MTSSDDELREYWRKQLSGGVLDELFEEAKNCGHKGSCWDLVNMLADILTVNSATLIQQERDNIIKQIKSDVEDCGRPFTPLQDALDTVDMSDDGKESGDNTINQRMVIEYLEHLTQERKVEE